MWKRRTQITRLSSDLPQPAQTHILYIHTIFIPTTCKIAYGSSVPLRNKLHPRGASGLWMSRCISSAFSCPWQQTLFLPCSSWVQSGLGVYFLLFLQEPRTCGNREDTRVMGEVGSYDLKAERPDAYQVCPACSG